MKGEQETVLSINFFSVKEKEHNWTKVNNRVLGTGQYKWHPESQKEVSDFQLINFNWINSMEYSHFENLMTTVNTFSERPAGGLYPQPDASSPYCLALLPKFHLNIIIPSVFDVWTLIVV